MICYIKMGIVILIIDSSRLNEIQNYILFLVVSLVVLINIGCVLCYIGDEWVLW